MTSPTSPEDDLKALLKAMTETSSLESKQLETSFRTSNYNPSLVAVATFGLMSSFNMYLISHKWPALLSGLIACVQGSLVYEWFNLHGMKLTRKERIYFDEKNILETSKQFDFNLPPVSDDLTPGNITEERESALTELFRNEKDEQMQKWYQMHYGSVYEHAQKAERERKMTQEVTKK
ncbi:putative integral membrane protein [Acanthocheilonema viteae]